MRKHPIHFAVGLVALFGITVGCAITNYPVIDDNEQTNSSVGPHIVQTSGDAIIVPDIQVVTIYADEALEFLSFVDQDGDGNQTIWTKVNSCDAGEPCYMSPNWFAGMTFINPDNTGCWIWKAPNPVVGDDDIFDGQYNAACDKKGNLKVLTSVGARLTEGGKDGQSGQNASASGGSTSQSYAGGVTIHDVIGALGQLDAVGVYGDHTAEYGLEGWKVTTTPDNFELTLNDTRIMVDGVVFALDVRNGRAAVDARTGNASDVLNQVADFVDANGTQATLSITFAGISPSFEIGLMDSDHYRALADRAN